MAQPTVQPLLPELAAARGLPGVVLSASLNATPSWRPGRADSESVTGTVTGRGAARRIRRCPGYKALLQNVLKASVISAACGGAPRRPQGPGPDSKAWQMIGAS